MTFRLKVNPKLAVAPMMDFTDRHFRYLLRLISPNILLYTEMITANAIIYGDRDYLLGYDQSEHPVALQLGGSDPVLLAQAAEIAQDYGYDEINLNVGCPSPRVKKGRFGACLMLEPELVAECVSAMRAKVRLPVTVKSRIGVDDQDAYESLCYFVEQIQQAGCDHLTVHARKAWLSGLSPKENRDIPPLDYPLVWRLRKDFPDMPMMINGGIKTVADVKEHLCHVDGVMLGRIVCSDPYILASLEREIYHNQEVASRIEIVRKMLPYIDNQLRSGVRLNALTRHLLCLFQGEIGAKKWRRHISENAHLKTSGLGLVETALQFVS